MVTVGAMSMFPGLPACEGTMSWIGLDPAGCLGGLATYLTLGISAGFWMGLYQVSWIRRPIDAVLELGLSLVNSRR